MIVHGACGKSWTGAGRVHCGGCHETFTGETAADKHRTGVFGVDRRCLPPMEAGLVAREKPWGVLWGAPAADMPFWQQGRRS